MPRKAKVSCIDCGQRCDGPRCEQCKRQKNANRQRDPFYWRKPWRQLRECYLAEHPLCEHCEANGITNPAQHVDHRLPRSTHPELELEWTNLCGLCPSCHSRKTMTHDT